MNRGLAIAFLFAAGLPGQVRAPPAAGGGGDRPAGRIKRVSHVGVRRQRQGALLARSQRLDADARRPKTGLGFASYGVEPLGGSAASGGCPC